MQKNKKFKSQMYNKYGRSVRDFLVVSLLTVIIGISLLFATAWFIDDGTCSDWKAKKVYPNGCTF